MTDSPTDTLETASDAQLLEIAKTLDSLSGESLTRLYQLMSQELNHDRSKLLVELPIMSSYNVNSDNEKTYVGVVIDTETTGLKKEVDDIIELSIVGFEFSQSGKIFNVQTLYTGYEETSIELPHEVKIKTGLTNEDLIGHKFDDDAINEIIGKAAIVVAHNAKFDRGFVEKRFPVFENKHWACSLNDVNWLEESVDSRGLQALLNHYGYMFSGHRAEIDCYAVIHLMNQELTQTGENVLLSMLDAMRLPNYHIYCYDADISTKDTLQGRGYWWHPGDHVRKKCWHKPFEEKDLQVELDFLRTTIYPRDSKDRFGVEKIGSLVRYSDRQGEIVETKRPQSEQQAKKPAGKGLKGIMQR